MRVPIIALLPVLGAIVVAGGQSSGETKLHGQLKRLFPAATAFSSKEGSLPHFKAYMRNSRSGLQTFAGLAFWTTELDPLERGYDGPIKILVGMDTKGILAGIIVVDHHEPYGPFSVDPPEFAAQFKGKSIRDPFKVGADIDGVSGASLSISSATRAIKNSARRAARQLLTPEAQQ